MRILVCSIEAPLPPINGFRLYLSSVLEELRRRHEVRVVALLGPDQAQPRDGSAELRLVAAPPSGTLSHLGDRGRSLLTRNPAGAVRAAKALRHTLVEEIHSFQPDVVHVASGRLAGIAPLVCSRPSVLAALDAWHLNVDADIRAADGLRRSLLRVHRSFVRRFEARQFGRFDRVVVVSDEDEEALLELNPSLALTVIPNGVDTDLFHPDPDGPLVEDRITFSGVMSYTPNVDAAEFLARRVFARVRRARPKAQLVLVGRDPHPRVTALAALDGVEVTGDVPEMRPWLVASRAYACTMVSGTGIKNKLLEAMASRLPCVATPLALQGIEAKPGVHVLVGEREEELAEHLGRLLDDEDESRRLGRAARDYVVSQHSWSAVVERYERVYEEVVERAGR